MKKKLPESKSLFPYYGYEIDGSLIEDGLEDGQPEAGQSMTALWNSLHPSREINGSTLLFGANFNYSGG